MNTKITLIIKRKPMAKQSFRMGKRGAFLPKKQKEEMKALYMIIKNQIPKGFKMFKGALIVSDLVFAFKHPKSFKKKERMFLQSGGELPKITRPDLQDNLCKMIFDVMQKVGIYKDDAQVIELHSKKVWASSDYIKITIEEINNKKGE